MRDPVLIAIRKLMRKPPLSCTSLGVPRAPAREPMPLFERLDVPPPSHASKDWPNDEPGKARAHRARTARKCFIRLLSSWRCTPVDCGFAASLARFSLSQKVLARKARTE